MEKRIIPNEILLPEIAALLATGKEVILKVKGYSMLPFIRHNYDSVLLRKEDTLVVGDIVLAQTSMGGYVLHRILSIENNKITLMGDGNPTGVEYTTAEQVAGKAIYVIKGEDGHRVFCYSKSQRLKAKIWKALLPLRPYLLKIYRMTHGMDEDSFISAVAKAFRRVFRRK